MADTPNQPPSGGSGGRPQYTEMNQYGESVDHGSDAGYKSIVAAIDNMTNTLIKELPSQFAGIIKGELGADQPTGHHGGSAGGIKESSGTAMFEASAREIAISSTKITKDFYNFEKNYEKLVDLIHRSSAAMAGDVKEAIFSFTASVISGRKALNDYTDLLRKSTREYSGTGLASFISVIKNDLSSGAVSLGNTMDLIMDKAKEGNGSFMASGDSAEEFGKRLRSARDGIEESGVDLYSKLGYKDQQSLLMDINDQLVSQGFRTKVDSVETKSMTSLAFKYYSEIAKNTGLTVGELIKMNNKDHASKINEAINRGLIGGASGANLLKLTEALNSKPLAEFGGNRVADVFSNMAMNGGNAALAISRLGEGYQDLLPAIGAIQEAYNHIGSVTPENQKDVINQLGDALSLRFKGTKQIGSVGVGYIDQYTATLGEKLSAYGSGADERKDKGEPNTFIERWINKIGAILNDFSRIKAFTDLVSGISGLTLALYLNTTALFANTGVFGMIKNLFKGPGFAARQLAALAPEAGAAAGATGAIGKSAFGTINGVGAKVTGAFGGFGGAALKMLGVATTIFDVFSIISSWSDKLANVDEKFKTPFEKNMNVAGEGIFQLGTTLVMFAGPIGFAIGGVLKALDFMTDGLLSKLTGELYGDLAWLLESISDFMSSAFKKYVVGTVKWMFGFGNEAVAAQAYNMKMNPIVPTNMFGFGNEAVAAQAYNMKMNPIVPTNTSGIPGVPQSRVQDMSEAATTIGANNMAPQQPGADMDRVYDLLAKSLSTQEKMNNALNSIKGNTLSIKNGQSTSGYGF